MLLWTVCRSKPRPRKKPKLSDLVSCCVPHAHGVYVHPCGICRGFGSRRAVVASPRMDVAKAVITTDSHRQPTGLHNHVAQPSVFGRAKTPLGSSKRRPRPPSIQLCLQATYRTCWTASSRLPRSPLLHVHNHHLLQHPPRAAYPPSPAAPQITLWMPFLPRMAWRQRLLRAQGRCQQTPPEARRSLNGTHPPLQRPLHLLLCNHTSSRPTRD